MIVRKPGSGETSGSSILARRKFIIPTANGYKRLSLGSVIRIASLLALCLVIAGATFLALGHAAGQRRSAEQARQAEELRQAVVEGRRSREAAEARLRQIISELERSGARQRDTIDALGERGLTLARELEVARAQLAALALERDVALEGGRRDLEAARRVVLALAEAAARPRDDDDDAPATLVLAGGAAAPERVAAPDELAADEPAGDELATVKARLAAATEERDLARRSERGLRWRVEVLETRLAEMRQGLRAEGFRLRAWVAQQVSALEGVLASSGVDVDGLVSRVDAGLSTGQGGPLEPVPSGDPGGAARAEAPGGAQAAALQPALRQELSRLEAVHVLLRAMPLTPPMTTYRLTSDFGTRRDPLTRRAAMHTGQDFGGPTGARTLATAPGRVVEAGRAGAYGIMVEVDHGMGIRTRYSHLREALVKVGDQVGLQQPVGIMGNTGRSTGEHLHYEVRIDGVAYDPADFLEAGKDLGKVLQG